MAFPASPVPSYYANASQSVRNGIYYQSDLNANQNPPPPNVTWVVGSVRIKP